MKKIKVLILMILFFLPFSGCSSSEKESTLKNGNDQTGTPSEEVIFQYETEDVEKFLREYANFLSQEKITVEGNEFRRYDTVTLEDFKIYENLEDLKRDFPNVSVGEEWKTDSENFVVCLMIDTECGTEIQQKQLDPEFQFSGLEVELLLVHRNGKNISIQSLERLS